MSTLGDRPPDDPFVSTAEFHEHVTREQRRSWGTPLIILEGTGAEKWVRYNSTPLKQNRSDLSPPVSRLPLNGSKKVVVLDKSLAGGTQGDRTLFSRGYLAGQGETMVGSSGHQLGQMILWVKMDGDSIKQRNM